MLELFLKLIYIDPLKVNNQMQESRGAPAKKPAPDYFLWGLKFYILREFACMGKPRFAGTWWWSRNTKRTGCRLLNDQLLKWTARLVLSSCWSVWILGFACIRHCLMFACSRVCQYVVFDLQVNHEIQNTIFVLQRGGEEWARKGSYRRKLCFIRRLWKMIWRGTLEEFYIMILIKKKMVLFSMLCLFLVACETLEHKHYCMIASGGILALTLSFQWPQPELKQFAQRALPITRCLSCKFNTLDFMLFHIELEIFEVNSSFCRL